MLKLMTQKGYSKPWGYYQYKARDGYYYNGYILSSDCSEDLSNSKEYQDILKKLFIDRFYDHGNGD